MFASFAAARRVGARRSASERVGARRSASSCGASLIPCHADLRLGRVACVACVALCHGDCCWAGRVGGAVSLGLVSRASRGWRRVIRIGAQSVVWVAPCH